MSHRKDQEAARNRAAEPINLGKGRVSYASTSDAFGADTVHRRFAEKQARQAGKTAATEERVYGFDFGRNTGFSEHSRYSYEFMDFGKERAKTYWHWNGPGRGYEEVSPDDDVRDAVLEQVLRRIAARYGRTYDDVCAAYHTRRGWHADAPPAEKFRVLPDGTIDLHPSQWSVIR